MKTKLNTGQQLLIEISNFSDEKTKAYLPKLNNKYKPRLDDERKKIIEELANKKVIEKSDIYNYDSCSYRGLTTPNEKGKAFKILKKILDDNYFEEKPIRKFSKQIKEKYNLSKFHGNKKVIINKLPNLDEINYML